ncbi:MAG: FAD:protein FMN transferase, partial [Sphingobacteriaceae bacterium]|nr:FAD:protein FMN transferase [Cytophagaceae bacterium]
VTVGRLTRLWRQTRKTRRLPVPDTLRRALATVGMQHLQLDSVGHQVLLLKPGTRLDLGGIGKGYAAQVMLAFLQKNGFPSALVDAAGNLAIGGEPPSRGDPTIRQGVLAWRIAVQLPAPGEHLIERQLLLQNVGVSTSGDAFQFVEIGGKRYSHIVSPRTGLGLTTRRQVTVLAADASLADWLSTACCLLSVEKALALVKRMKGEVLMLEPVRNQIQARISPGFSRFFAPE